ncbi:hypothetical protein [Geodermatophilus sp. DSM 44513]|uniref:hypothetical protein n=1 Tax=Geodermatophilus sp. DSM 44513 TaxID=1528104 RepID=UPI00126F7C53|nr:hypothetical protein [Geodermatophilus sp. DSM 44513]WNV74577.1 hypothetical protein RTG05_16505 [Geodermatophilus sp. DSM 44513]
MPVAPHRPPQLRGRLFRGSHAVRDSLLTPAQLRSSAWRRVYPDVYACASVRLTHPLRALAVTRLLVAGAVASGRSAAVLHGVDLAGPDDDVECTVPAGCRAGALPGVRLSRRALGAGDVTVIRGVPATDAVRTALDLGRIRPPEEAVVALDRFTGARVVDLDVLRAAAAGLTGRGCRAVRWAVGRADGLAGSPPETRLRLLLHDSGLPRPVAQYTVRDGRGFVARVDFAWPGQRLAVEYEGHWHGRPQQVPEDRARLNRLTAAGWRVVFVTAADLHRPELLVQRIRAALGPPRPA